ERGVSIGRTPDGSPLVRRLSSPTPASLNTGRKQEEVIINEIMYKPISNDDDDQYVELLNRTSSPIDISGCRLKEGIDFTFPTNTTIAGNGYIVVAHSLERMLTNYPHLNTNNTFGDINGRLAGGGERIALAKPGVNPTEFVTVHEVSYMSGGRWSDLANGN